MASPIQIILNDADYQETRDVSGGGPKKDFFAERDEAFRRHKATLIRQLTTVSETIQTQPQGDVGYVKVILRRDAWAKSHRPLKSLFRADRIRLVGGGDLGELYFEGRPLNLVQVSREIAGAEDVTNLVHDDRTDKLVPHPSAARSEAGAIERIELYGPRDRRRFSVEEAIAWLSNPMTGSGYQIELFDVPPPRSSWDAFDTGHQKLYRTFLEGLASAGDGVTVQRLATRDRSQPLLAVRLGRSTEQPTLQLTARADRGRERSVTPFDATHGRHAKLLAFLENHPLVRRIELPAIVVRNINGVTVSAKSSGGAGRARPGNVALPIRNTANSYPKLGVVDGGIAPVLADWVVGRWDLLDTSDIDPDHATFIAGLAVGGNGLNGAEVCAEADGAEIVDVAIFPDDAKPNAFQSYYPDGISQFFDEIEYAVADAKARHNVRVFNMSLNILHSATPDQYGVHAARLDQIAEANDAIFFISAGNTQPQNLRPEWPADETQALVNLASARNDSLLMPAESVRNISVAAVNPPGLAGCIDFSPTRYSCRGPGLRAGVKPDLAHVGGTGSPQNPTGHGLYSIRPDGSVGDDCGTSYAAPIVARTAASLEHSIEGPVSRETLMGLLLHHARVPEMLQTKALRGVARDLVGFGIPPSAVKILEGGDDQITLVFASRLRRDQEIVFRFAWPPSLVGADGKCRGAARLTLVSTPPLDTRFGSEFVRVNLDAALQQEDFDKDGNAHWKGRLDPIYLPGKADRPGIEAERIEHGLKWSPVKAYAKTIPRGIGKSSSWRLFVNYLTRAAEEMPEEGVPFTALLTISDPKGEQPVFNDMRQVLNALGVRIEDIRTAARVSTRV